MFNKYRIWIVFHSLFFSFWSVIAIYSYSFGSCSLQSRYNISRYDSFLFSTFNNVTFFSEFFFSSSFLINNFWQWLVIRFWVIEPSTYRIWRDTKQLNQKQISEMSIIFLPLNCIVVTLLFIVCTIDWKDVVAFINTSHVQQKLLLCLSYSHMLVPFHSFLTSFPK